MRTRLVVVALAVGVAVSCESPFDLPINGSLRVSVATAGGDLDLDGYTLLIDGVPAALTSGGHLSVTDWFTPDGWSTLNDLDNDLGSCGPLLTASGMLIGGGKEGVLYVIDRNQIVKSFYCRWQRIRREP